MLHLIFKVDVPSLNGGYTPHAVRWDDTALMIRVFEDVPGGVEVLTGYDLDYVPLVGNLYTVTESDGDKITFTQVQSFPYAELAPQAPAPTAPDDLVLSVTKTDATVNGGTGAVAASVTGTNSPFSFTLNGGSQKSGTSVSWSSLVPGTYTVEVTDAAGYKRSATLTITEPAAVLVYGCTDPTATNYDPTATTDNGTCTYNPETFICMTVEVRPCEPRGVYLRWYNNVGGIDSWLFTGQVDTLNAAEAMGEFSEFSGLAGAAVKTAERGKLVRTSKLTLNEWENLTGIFTSDFVWQHYEDGRTEQVYVKPASSTYAKNQKELAVEILRVPVNTLTR